MKFFKIFYCKIKEPIRFLKNFGGGRPPLAPPHGPPMVAAHLTEDTRVEVDVPVVQREDLALVELCYRPLACTEKNNTLSKTTN